VSDIGIMESGTKNRDSLPDSSSSILIRIHAASLAALIHVQQFAGFILATIKTLINVSNGIITIITLEFSPMLTDIRLIRIIIVEFGIHD